MNACERDTRNSVRIHTGFGGAIVITVEWWDDGESAYIGNSVTVTVANDVTCEEICGEGCW